MNMMRDAIVSCMSMVWKKLFSPLRAQYAHHTSHVRQRRTSPRYARSIATASRSARGKKRTHLRSHRRASAMAQRPHCRALRSAAARAGCRTAMATARRQSPLLPASSCEWSFALFRRIALRIAIGPMESPRTHRGSSAVDPARRCRSHSGPRRRIYSDWCSLRSRRRMLRPPARLVIVAYLQSRRLL